MPRASVSFSNKLVDCVKKKKKIKKNDDADAVDADLTQPVVAAAFSVVECDGFPIIT